MIVNRTAHVLLVLAAVGLCATGCSHPEHSPAVGLSPTESTEVSNSTSGNSWTYLREAQRLLAMGKIEEGSREAQKAKELFLMHDQRPAWVILETITARNITIQVQMNLRDDVANPPQIGIVRPLSFRILTQDPENRLLETIDFEIGTLDGAPSTAALGKTTPSGHANFGTLDPGADYSTIRENVLKLSGERHAHIGPPPKTKDFLNISLPTGSRFTPLVLSPSGDRLIVARVCFVDGRRDIQVIENWAGEWRPLGANGGGITGVGGNFLSDAVIGPDGRLWVLAAYSRPSNSDRGNTHYLYVFDGKRWKLAGPRKGHPSGSMADRGIGFLGDTLVHHFVGYDLEKKRDKPYLLYLDDATWEPVAAQGLLRQRQGELVWTSSNAWYFVCSEKEDRTVVNAYIVSGVAEKDVSGPHPVVEAPGAGYAFKRFSVSDRGNTAVVLQRERDDKKEWFCCLVGGIGNDGENKIVTLPDPPIKYYAHTLTWSPTGELVIIDLPGGNTVTVYALRNNQWVRIAETSQPHEEGNIFDHRLFFTAEGVPIVTWEDFFPH